MPSCYDAHAQRHLITVDRAVEWFRQLAVGFSPLRPGSVHVGLKADKVALGVFFSEFYSIPLSISFHCGSPYSYTSGR
jgi:hypothetical protein